MNTLLHTLSTPGAARRTLRLGLLLAVAAITALLLATAAHADPGPTPAPAPAPGQAPAPAPAPQPAPEPGPPEPAPAATPPAEDAGKSPGELAKEKKDKAKKDKAGKRAAWDKKVEQFKEEHAGNGVLGVFSVSDEDNIPAEAYEVVLDSGDATDFEQKIQAFLIEGMFAITKWIIAFSCWLIAWALSWSLASILLKPALAVSDALYGQTVVQLGLPSLLMAFSGTVAFWHLFFGNRSRGWGEIVASTVIAALAVTTFAAPPQLLLAHDEGAVGQVRSLGLTVAALVMGREDALPANGEVNKDTAKALTRPITDALVESFVVKPSMLLSYDQTFNGACATQYRESRIEQALFNQEFDKTKKKIQDDVNNGTVTEKPSWAQSIDSFIMDKALGWLKDQVVDTDPGEEFEKKCVKGDAGAAKKASWDKVGGAFFVLLAAILVFALILVLSGKFLITQALLALEAMLARVAVTAGILPGPGRSWLWDRAMSILRLLGSLIAIVVGLAVFILLVTTVLDVKKTPLPGFKDGNGGLTIRFFVVDLVCIAVMIYRKKIAARGRAWSTQARTRLGATRFGGGAPAQLDNGGPRRRSKIAKIAGAGLMLGAMAATGGGSAAALGSTSVRGALGTRMAARAARAGGRGALRATAGTAKAAAKTAGAVGKFGLKYSAGAPVYVPRAARTGIAAARTATAAAQAMPARARHTAQSLQQRLHTAVGPTSRTGAFAAEYLHNTGGRHLLNRIRLHRGMAPIPPPPRRSNSRTRTSPPSSPGPRARTRPTGAPLRPPAAPASRTTPPPPARRRPVPTPVPAPPASARQAALQRRLHRTRQTPPPVAPSPQPGPVPGNRARPARPRNGGRP